MERKTYLVVGRLSMMAAIVLLAPVDGLNVLSDFSGVFHGVLGVESCGEGVVERVWGSGLGCLGMTLPGVLCLGECLASGLVCGNWCAYRQVSPRAHLGK